MTKKIGLRPNPKHELLPMRRRTMHISTPPPTHTHTHTAQKSLPPHRRHRIFIRLSLFICSWRGQQLARNQPPLFCKFTSHPDAALGLFARYVIPQAALSFRRRVEDAVNLYIILFAPALVRLFNYSRATMRMDENVVHPLCM